MRKKTLYQIWQESIDFRKSCQPYWICHVEFFKSDFRFFDVRKKIKRAILILVVHLNAAVPSTNWYTVEYETKNLILPCVSCFICTFYLFFEIGEKWWRDNQILIPESWPGGRNTTDDIIPNEKYIHFYCVAVSYLYISSKSEQKIVSQWKL